MKILSRTCLFLSVPLLLFMTGCGDGDGQKNAADTVSTTTGEIMSDMDQDKDGEFVEDMMEDNTRTIAWLKAGVKMGTDAQLKTDAAAMLKDHEDIDKRLRELASRKSYELDDLDKKDSTTDAAGDKRGADWDDDWADKMKGLHEKMTNRLTDYSDDVRDADLKTFINDALPKMNHHLTMSKALDDRLHD